jgi:hypothetical protein
MEYDNKHKTVQTTLEQIIENCASGTSNIVEFDNKSLILIANELDGDPIYQYRGVEICMYNKRFTICKNSDLIDLGLCTPENLQSGRPGISTRKGIIHQIDAAMDYRCTRGGACFKRCSICKRANRKRK